MENNMNIELYIKEQNIAADNAKQLIAAFGAPFTQAGEILATYESIVVTDESQKDDMALAKTKRLALKKVRTTVENRRKELKEDSLRTGKAIDSVAKFIKDTIVPAENYLEQQEKFAELQEAKRAAALKELRTNELLKYTEYENTLIYPLVSMTQEQFDKVVSDLKAAKELQAAKEKAYEDDQKRIALEKEADGKRIRDENAKLKAELDAANAAQAKIDADKLAAEQSAAKAASAPGKVQLLAFVAELALMQVPTDTDVAKRIRTHIATSTEMYLKLINEQL